MPRPWLLVALLEASCVHTGNGGGVTAVTAVEAEAIARRTAQTLVPPAAPAIVTEGADAFVVTFPIELTEGVRGADFRARVHVRRSTGAVTKVEVPP